VVAAMKKKFLFPTSVDCFYTDRQFKFKICGECWDHT